MAKIHLYNSVLINITISRLSRQLAENHGDFSDSVILGLQPRGVFFAERIRKRLQALEQVTLPLGYIDSTFYRDDFRKKGAPLRANTTKIPFDIEEKRVILIDDVLYTGRSVRAAISAMLSFGRPSEVELLVLINRKYGRHLPIEPNYIGQSVNTIQSQRVIVEWKEQGFAEDNIWLANQQA